VRPVSGFVTRDGPRLMLGGSEWFFGGTNWCGILPDEGEEKEQLHLDPL
jgi:hypothetical protein